MWVVKELIAYNKPVEYMVNQWIAKMGMSISIIDIKYSATDSMSSALIIFEEVIHI